MEKPRGGYPTLVAIVLIIAGVIGLTLEAFGVRPRLVSLGWLGLAVVAFAVELLPHLHVR